jgi:hypothetical protein
MLDKLATEVVDGFFNQKTPLTEGVVKAAERENLNPEHIKRLVEAANNMTFLRKFSSAEPGADRMVDFETADASSAIQRMLDAAKDLMAAMPEGPEGGCPMGDLPMTRDGAPEPLPEPEPEPETAEDPKVKGHAMIMRLRKTGELLREQHYQKRVELTEGLQKLATVFTRANGPSFDTFEKDAFYVWGGRVAPCLQLLRTTLHKPAANYDHAALTKVARIVDTGIPEMRDLFELAKCSRAITSLDAAIEKNTDYLRQLEQ